jgi:hypothetical protein
MGALNSTHIFGTLVPVEEPSTASETDMALLEIAPMQRPRAFDPEPADHPQRIIRGPPADTRCHLMRWEEGQNTSLDEENLPSI